MAHVLLNKLLNMDKTSNNMIISNDINKDIYLSKENINTNYKLENNSSFKLNIIDFNNSNSFLNLKFDLLTNSSLEINIINIALSQINKEYQIEINHTGKDSYSLVKIAGINLGGKINILASSRVKKGASGSDTRIEGKITNLSNSAKSKISPILYIDENDVKASHSASLGSYNLDSLYYLISRGISIKEAKKSITYGSIYPLINQINDIKIKDKSIDYLKGLKI